MKNRVAVVFCVHHKPWLIMSTLVTVLAQDFKDLDLYFAYNLGDGSCPDKPSYQEYHRTAAECGVNPQISAYDPRLKEVCQLNRDNLYELELDNDHALDSGAWYKFIRTSRWREYDYVFFFGEGTLLTRTNVLSAMLAFARARGVHLIGSGHEKRRLPKSLFLRYNAGGGPSHSALDRLHDRMISESFQVFCRDPEFKSLYDGWSSEIPGETQHHVPDIWGKSPRWRRAREIADGEPRYLASPASRIIGLRDGFIRRNRNIFPWLDYAGSRFRASFNGVAGHCPAGNGRSDPIYVNAVRRNLGDVVPLVLEEAGVRFHKAAEPEWFAGTIPYMMSREFLERLSDKLERYSMYDVLDLPYSATALEVIWGFIPAWLGYEKWFTDGIHRVRKNFVTYRREDDCQGMASYINRYYRGQMCVAPKGDYLKVKRVSKELSELPKMLNLYYS